MCGAWHLACVVNFNQSGRQSWPSTHLTALSLLVHLLLDLHLTTLGIQIFFAVFPCCNFTKYSSFSLLITWPKKVAWRFFLIFYEWVILCQLLVTLFRLIFFQSTRFIAFSLGIIFLLRLFSFIAILSSSRPSIHTSGWVQFSTPGLFLVWMEMNLFVKIIST